MRSRSAFNDSDRSRSCDPKVRFETRQAAQAAVERLRRAKDRRMLSYRCRHCAGYHLSTAGGRA